MLEDLKVMVCDDSPLIRKNMNNILTKIGVKNIIEATDGEMAVVKYAETMPDVVFMDIVMPNKTGIDALKDIKSLDPSAKVIMASSVGTQTNLKTAIENGAFDFAQKPISEEVILKILNKFN